MQIRDFIIDAVTRQLLRPGDRLPTVSGFAKDLGVTRATVLRALEDLRSGGYIVAYVGRGTFIANPSESALTNRCEQDSAAVIGCSRLPLMRSDPEFALAARRLRMGIARSLEALEILLQRPGLLHLSSGIPDIRLTKAGILEKLTKSALQSSHDDYQRYSPSGGLPGLRQEVATWLSDSQLEITPDQVLITNGSQQAISLLAQAALENNRRIICEVPCYAGIAKAFGAVGHWVETIVRNEDGPMLERLEQCQSGRPALLYLCPQLHNPMGTDLCAKQRRRLTSWVQQNDAVMIADEIFRDLRFEGAKPPSLIADAGVGHTVVIGSLSKSFMCGLRIGWLVSSAERIRSLLELKRAMDIGSPPLMQGIALTLLRSGEYRRHLQNVRTHYQMRRDAALQALSTNMPSGITWTRPPRRLSFMGNSAGGLFQPGPIFVGDRTRGGHSSRPFFRY